MPVALFAVPQISIATQCDTTRFRERIPEIARVWRGPIVVAVLLRSIAEMDDVRAAVALRTRYWHSTPFIPRCMHACGIVGRVHLRAKVAKRRVLTRHHVDCGGSCG